MPAGPSFPGGARFAFTILDDTDVATVDNVAPVYRLLESLGMRTTKTVWPVACREGSENFASSQTLEDADYLEFVRDLSKRGFEITWHGATMESSPRERTIVALERFHSLFGSYPRVHANHATNRENLYWGADRIDLPLLKSLFSWLTNTPRGYYAGHEAASAYWWGDLCEQHAMYVRNLTFNELNLLRVNPSMPYFDPRRPLVDRWFSAADAEDASAFCELLAPSRLARLEEEGGVCIVATHFGKAFTRCGTVVPEVQKCLQYIASRRGWFPTVSELLDFLRARTGGMIPAREWRAMQWRWAVDLVGRKLQARTRRFRFGHRSAPQLQPQSP